VQQLDYKDKSVWANGLYKNIANTEVEWLRMDSKERFTEHLKTRKDDLQKYGWLDTKFTYKFNKDGFRSIEFMQNPDIMFLGCSYTLGIGLPVECTWPDIVTKALNIKSVNLGIGGGAIDTFFRISLHWINKLKPKTVVLYVPFKERLEIIRNNGYIYLSSHYFEQYNVFLEDWFANRENSYFNYLKNVLAIKQVCQDNNTKLIVFDETPERIDFARDLSHPGVETNKLIAQIALKHIESNQDFQLSFE